MLNQRHVRWVQERQAVCTTFRERRLLGTIRLGMGLRRTVTLNRQLEEGYPGKAEPAQPSNPLKGSPVRLLRCFHACSLVLRWTLSEEVARINWVSRRAIA